MFENVLTLSKHPYVVLPAGIEPDGPVGLKAYQEVAALTDKYERKGVELPILGLFGEVGSLLSVLKKRQRDQTSTGNYRMAVIEEVGDVLWYFSTIATRAGLLLPVLAQRMSRDIDDWDIVDEQFGCFGDLQTKADEVSDGEFSNRVLQLAGCVGDLLNDFRANAVQANRDKLSAHLVEIFRALIAATHAAEIDLDVAARENLLKIFSRWPIEPEYPPRIDASLRRNERLPPKLEFYIAEEETGHRSYVIQKCNQIIIGDRLTDNKLESDDYRFHDVFHMSFAVHLGWSPVLRALLHLKRKSDESIDENQDGARAILIEEGVATFIFGRGLSLGLFADQDKLDYDLLKMVQEFVRGYEPERCALWQWERAILDGFKVFRELKKARSGYVVADIENHTLSFRSGREDD